MLLAVMTVLGYFIVHNLVFFENKFSGIFLNLPELPQSERRRRKLNGHFLLVSWKGVSLRIIDLNRLPALSNFRDTRQQGCQPSALSVPSSISINIPMTDKKYLSTNTSDDNSEKRFSVSRLAQHFSGSIMEIFSRDSFPSVFCLKAN